MFILSAVELLLLVITVVVLLSPAAAAAAVAGRDGGCVSGNRIKVNLLVATVMELVVAVTGRDTSYN